MIGKMSWARHAVVWGVVVAGAVLVLAGRFGTPKATERYPQWQVIVEPAGEFGLDVTEVIDYDTGKEERPGLRRELGTDHGRPADITGAVTDASGDVQVEPYGAGVKVQIGDEDSPVTGQDRYTLGYHLPDGRYAVGKKFSFELADDRGLPIGSLTGTLTGLRLTDPVCHRGPLGSDTPCEISKVADGVYRVELHDVDAYENVVMEGTVEAIVDPAQVDVAEPPNDAPPSRFVTAILVLLSGGVTAYLVFAVARRLGRNAVYVDDPSDVGGALLSPATRLVSDAELSELATTRPDPPPGVAPWEASVDLFETLDDATVLAYVAGLASAQVVTLQPQGSRLAIGAGPRVGDAAPTDRLFVEQLLAIQNPFVSGTYDRRVAVLIDATKSSLRGVIRQRRWWRRGGPRMKRTARGWIVRGLNRVAGGVLGSTIGFGLTAVVLLILLGLVHDRWIAVLVASAVSGVVAVAAYSVLLPSRSASGSAVALEAESFRRFLHAAHAEDVERIWHEGRLDEYSAWAVALGEAEPWSRAVRVSAVTRDGASSAPLHVHAFGSSLSESIARSTSKQNRSDEA